MLKDNLTITPMPRMAAYKTDLFAEIQSLEARLEKISWHKSLLLMLNALLLGANIWLALFVLLFSDLPGFTIQALLNKIFLNVF